ncbi:MAG: thioredoxin domain-containing protein [Nitrospinales bacterium]
MSASTPQNQLIHETSQYLRHHAHNPVDWLPWSSEAWNLAKKEKKPVFLSIGYSSCHWCSVMARESFENPETAKLMNQWFVNIKVDREERPDIDSVYMQILIKLTGQAGWPMSVFLTPEQIPFFAGTYFPPKTIGGNPGFPDVLKNVHDIYTSSDSTILSRSNEIIKQLNQKNISTNSASSSSDDLIQQAVEIITERYDENFGGFGAGMKFPDTMIYMLLLRHWLKSESTPSIQMIDKSLTNMAEGGIYDQLGGGFHRYSTDRQWRVPHFEKMLNDNALLAKTFLHAFQATHQEIYANIFSEIYSTYSNSMMSKDGLFFSSQSADTDGVEGKYYCWSMKEILNLLGPKHAKVFAKAYGIRPTGNFSGNNVLHIQDSMEKIAEDENIPIFEVNHIVQKSLKSLTEARSKRVAPDRDEKVITAWNGMMITALSSGYSILSDEKYLNAAQKCADFIWENMWDGSVLLRIYQDGKSKINGCLEDYAYLLESFLALYEASFDIKWIQRAAELANSMIKVFWDESVGGFFITDNRHEKLVFRPKMPEDEAMPSANAIASLALLRLGRMTGKNEFTDAGSGTIKAFQNDMEQRPAAFAGLLSAVDFLNASPVEIILAGSREDPIFKELVMAAQADFRPNKLLMWNNAKDSSTWLPAVEGRTAVMDKPTAYICQKGTCHPPVHSAEALTNLLENPPIIKLNIFDKDKYLNDMGNKEQTNFLNAMSDIFKHSGFNKGQ